MKASEGRSGQSWRPTPQTATTEKALEQRIDQRFGMREPAQRPERGVHRQVGRGPDVVRQRQHEDRLQGRNVGPPGRRDRRHQPAAGEDLRVEACQELVEREGVAAEDERPADPAGDQARHRKRGDPSRRSAVARPSYSREEGGWREAQRDDERHAGCQHRGVLAPEEQALHAPVPPHQRPRPDDRHGEHIDEAEPGQQQASKGRVEQPTPLGRGRRLGLWGDGRHRPGLAANPRTAQRRWIAEQG